MQNNKRCYLESLKLSETIITPTSYLGSSCNLELNPTEFMDLNAMQYCASMLGSSIVGAYKRDSIFFSMVWAQLFAS